MIDEEKVIEIRNRKYYSQYYVNQLQQENKQLKEEIKWYEKENKHNQEIIVKDTSILTELEEWLKLVMGNTSLKWGENCAREFDLGCLEIEMTMKNYGEVLDKIQELKEKYKC